MTHILIKGAIEPPSRRSLLKSVVSASAAAVALQASPKASAQETRRTYVLIHGAWHGGWCWRRVADALEARGHRVFAPSLTGLADRSHLLERSVNLSTHIADVVNLVKWEDLTNVVLVGHSYGGLVISGAVESILAQVSALVFLDALVPNNGDSTASLVSPLVRDGIAATVRSGATTMKPVPAAVFKVNERDRAWVDAKCTPQPIACMTDAVLLTGAREKVPKKIYIRAVGYESPNLDAAGPGRVPKGDPTWRSLQLPCGHDAMIDMPEKLAEILLSA
jgi:pimeloyl-ACP methyl ester carboxylesterase